jgi:predicted NBD/HSP70 family sugar kinase
METYLDLKQAADSRLQNKINRSLIFHFLHEKGQATRVQIAREIGMSEPTVSRITADLVRQGYIVEAGKLVTDGGKRPSLIRINPNKGYIAVVDLVKVRLRAAVTNFNGDIVARREGFPITDSSSITDELIAELRAFFSELSRQPESGFDERLLLSLCLGMPAETDPRTGAPTRGSLYDNWLGIPFKDILEDAFRVPVFIERDVVLSVLAEKNYGEGKHFKDIVYVEVSNGVATGIIMDNRVIRATGALGFAGEPGYAQAIRKDRGGSTAPRYDKHFGSIRRLEEEAARRLGSAAGPPAGSAAVSGLLDSERGDAGRVSAAGVFAAAHEGNTVARELIADMVGVLSRGLANLILTLYPEIVVIGGELSTLPHVEELFLAPVREKIDGMVPFETPRIEMFSLHEDAILIGGAVAAMDSLLMQEFPYKGGIPQAARP